MPADPGLWDPRPIPTGQALLCQFGPLAVWMDYQNDELRVGSSRNSPKENPSFVKIGDPPGEAGTNVERFAFQTDKPTVRAVPVLPDRSVVVIPESLLTLLPRESALFFISIPIWVRFDRLNPDPTPLTTLPTVILSNTFYGEPTSGELCYAVKSRARRNLEDLEKRSWRVICPITIRNEDEDPLKIARICVQVRHLGIFQGVNHLWTNPVGILNSESGQALRLTYANSPPERETIIRSLTQPRDPVNESFIHRGLSNLRLPGF